MDEGNVGRIRKWVIRICVVTPLVLIGVGVLGLKSMLDFAVPKRPDPETYVREQKALRVALQENPAATRDIVLKRMESDPPNAWLWLEYLLYAETYRLERVKPSEQQAEAQKALMAQLAGITMIEKQNRTNMFAAVVGDPKVEYAWADAVKFAILAKNSDAIRPRATQWTKLADRGPISDQARAHQGYQYLGWADLIDGDVDGAARNLIRSGDFMDAPTLKSFGPSTKLADALVTKGRYSDVITWLEKVGQHWQPGITAEWIRWLKKGKRPGDEAWTQQFDY